MDREVPLAHREGDRAEGEAEGDQDADEHLLAPARQAACAQQGRDGGGQKDDAEEDAAAEPALDEQLLERLVAKPSPFLPARLPPCRHLALPLGPPREPPTGRPTRAGGGRGGFTIRSGRRRRAIRFCRRETSDWEDRMNTLLAVVIGVLTVYLAYTLYARRIDRHVIQSEVAAGRHVLMAAPTGSGKTLAAFLWCLDRLASEPVPADGERCRVLYVSPLKALAHDVDRNLRSPLVGIRHQMESQGIKPPDISVAIRTGDTPTEVRRSMERHPPDILITTPESLFLILTSAARKILAPVRWLIVDEIHSVASTKRGSHLALSLERLCELTRVEPQRIGLSATQRPLEEVGRFLGGMDRQVSIVDAGRLKTMEVKVEVPVEDMTRLTDEDEDSAKGQNSIWPAIYPRLLQLIREHRSTIVFVNSRRLAERIAARVNDLAEEELVRAHHGSIAREQRMLIEDELKAGVVRGLIATSTLELGIDMGAVDLVLQVEAPPSVAARIQRVGRAGHSVGEVSKGVVIPNFRGGLLESAAVVEGMLEGRIESTVVPRKPLDVLAQQVVAICAMDEWHVDELATLVRRAYPYSDLGPRALESVLDMLSGRYPSDEFAELRPRIVWDRVAGTIRGRAGAQRLAVTNPGTIPDRGLYSVNLVDDGRRVGELDEEMVYESRVGETFVLGASTWRIAEITPSQVLVTPAPGEPGKIAFWTADAPSRPVELGAALGKMVRELRALDADAAAKRVRDRAGFDDRAVKNLLAYLEDQAAATGSGPDDRTVVVERFRDEIGDWRVCLHTPLGSRVHAPLALALEARLQERLSVNARALWTA